jgi:hypothetical protein
VQARREAAIRREVERVAATAVATLSLRAAEAATAERVAADLPVEAAPGTDAKNLNLA